MPPLRKQIGDIGTGRVFDPNHDDPGIVVLDCCYLGCPTSGMAICDRDPAPLHEERNPVRTGHCRQQMIVMHLDCHVIVAQPNGDEVFALAATKKMRRFRRQP